MLACDRLGLRTVEDLLRAGEVSESDIVRLREALSARRAMGRLNMDTRASGRSVLITEAMF